ncbi:MAG TPA: hypothetical protein VGN22_17860 [Pseudonocardia sp.]
MRGKQERRPGHVRHLHPACDGRGPDVDGLASRRRAEHGQLVRDVLPRACPRVAVAALDDDLVARPDTGREPAAHRRLCGEGCAARASGWCGHVSATAVPRPIRCAVATS